MLHWRLNLFLRLALLAQPELPIGGAFACAQRSGHASAISLSVSVLGSIFTYPIPQSGLSHISPIQAPKPKMGIAQSRRIIISAALIRYSGPEMGKVTM